MKRIQNIRMILFFFFLAAAVLFAIAFPRLTLPFGFSYIVYLMFNPLKQKLTTGSKRQRIFVSVVMSAGVAFMLLPLFATLYNADTKLSIIYQQLPELQKLLTEKFFLFKVKVFEKTGFNITVDPVKYVILKMESYGADILSQIPNYLSSIFEWLLLVPLFLYFFFKESSNFSRWFMSGIPNPIFEKTYVLFTQFNTKFGDYIIAKFIEAAILGVLVTVGLLVIDFPFPFMLGFVAGITNILPYIGPVIGYVPALLVVLLSKDPNATILGMSVVFGVANLIDMVLVFPLLVSRIVDLHPIIVVVSIVVGSQLGGIAGMIVIIPFIAFFKLLFQEIFKDLTIRS